MRIAMLTSWNATDGTSCHAELLGRELARTNEVRVFAPTVESMASHPAHLPLGEDEDYVVRGFEQTWGARGWVDQRLCQEHFDVLLVETLERMPIPTLREMFPRMEARKVQVVHEWALPDLPAYYELGFDAIVCFDGRYRAMLLERYPEELVHVIPFPCHPPARGDREKARKRLGLPKDTVLLFSFGRQPLVEYEDYLWLANELAQEYGVTYLVLRADNPRDWESVGSTLRAGSSACAVWFERPTTDRVYQYLHAADVHLVPKAPTGNIVVSSTVFQCLGAGTPIVIPDTRYVEGLEGEVVKYRVGDRAHLKAQVRRLLEDRGFRRRTLSAAREYVRRNSARRVAERFEALFRSLRTLPSAA